MKILQLCPDFNNTVLYKRLFGELAGQSAIEMSVFVPEHCESGEYPYEVFSCNRTFGIFDRVIYFRKQCALFDELCRNVNAQSFDVAHAHTLFSSGYMAYRLRQKFGIPYVVAVRNTDVNLFFKKMVHLRHLGVKIMKSASAVIFLSNSYYDQVLSNYVPSRIRQTIAEKCHIIPNGIDNIFHINRPQSGKEIGNVIKLIYVGILNRNKNVETTLEACRILLAQGENVELTIVGKIADKQYDRIADNGFVNYKPFCNKAELLKHYAGSDIFVMPSKFETFGLVYAEAMSQGLPVIYSKGQGFDGLFKDGHVGYSVDCQDAMGIADSVLKIRRDYGKMSQNCISESVRFDWTAISKVYRDIYDHIRLEKI